MNNKYIILFSIIIFLILYLEKLMRKHPKQLLKQNEMISFGEKTIFVNKI